MPVLPRGRVLSKVQIISKTSINTQQESKEIVRIKILEKADEVYEKIRPKVA